MEWLNSLISAEAVAQVEATLETWGSLAFLALFLGEILRLALKRRLSLRLLGDSAANFVTFGLFVVVTFGLLAAAYVSIFYWVYLNFALFEIPVTPWSIAVVLVLCDFAYYWEHRFSHRVGLAWATHSVHHSSPFFNISVAYRFGPMDGIWPLMFHLPLALAGFDPIVILACEAFVQFYQTALHTEVIRKLPRPIEAIFNTPSHHRVHHGANAAYIDKNYGGVFILWDRLFGTFSEEVEPVRFGLTNPIESNNPLVVWLHGFKRLAQRSWSASGFIDSIYAWIAPPEWNPGQPRSGMQGWLLPLAMCAVVFLWAGSTPGVAYDQEGSAVPAQDATVSEDAEGSEQDESDPMANVVGSYYRAYLDRNMDAAYSEFTDDALFHYRMDFGTYYGTSEFTFRASDPDAFENDVLDGYKVLNSEYAIRSIEQTKKGAVVEASLTENYRWQGYKGTMTAIERISLEIRGDRPVIVRFDSDQVYR